MEKLFRTMALLLICFFLTACRYTTEYKFIQPEENISAISIVTISFNQENEVVLTEDSVISDIDAFLEEFCKVRCYVYFGDPTGVTEEGVSAKVIKISFKDGSYELINWDGQAKYTSERGLDFYAGFRIFEKDNFFQLINNTGT